MMLLLLFNSVVTHAVEVPFSLPCVSPDTDEVEAIESLDSSDASKAIGWAIARKKYLLEGKEEMEEMKKKLRSVYIGRTATNWSILLFFVKQVCQLLLSVMLSVIHHNECFQIAIEVGDHELLKLCFEQVIANAPTSTPVCTSGPVSTFNPDTVKQTLVELLAVAKTMSLSQV